MNTAAELARQSDSVIIVLIVIIIMGIIALRPIIKMWVTSKENYHKREIEQQDKIISVIKSNTEVNTSLKLLLEEDHRNCNDCRIKITAIHTILLSKEVLTNANERGTS